MPGEGRALTHTKLSLRVQLEALGAAGFILFCKAKGMGPERTRALCPRHPGTDSSLAKCGPSCQPGQADVPSGLSQASAQVGEPVPGSGLVGALAVAHATRAG